MEGLLWIMLTIFVFGVAVILGDIVSTIIVNLLYKFNKITKKQKNRLLKEIWELE